MSVLTHPTPERILSLDVLRGFALFGIFYAHMVFWYAAGPLEQDIYQMYKGLGSGIAIGTYIGLIISKFFSIFSFLFGLSFYIQMRNLARRGDNVVLRFSWRLIILGAIGFAHHLLWRADILTIYVPLGFLLIAARHMSDRMLLITGLILALNIPSKLAELISIASRNQLALISEDLPAKAAVYTQILKNGSLSDTIAHNFHAFGDKLIYQINSGRLLITFGFFLLGMYVGRRGWLESSAQHAPLIKTILKKSGWLLLAAIFSAITLGIAVKIFQIDIEKTPLAGWCGGFILEFYNFAWTGIYITAITLLLLRPRWHRLLAPLAAVGKMALTVYLLQTCIGLLLFFPVGLHWFTLTTPGENAVLCVALFLLQLLACRWWLNHYNYGPIEWLWRCATDCRWRPFLRST